MRAMHVVLRGCDDQTKFTVHLTKREAMFVQGLCELSDKASTCGCQPTMQLLEGAVPIDPDDELTWSES